MPLFETDNCISLDKLRSLDSWEAFKCGQEINLSNYPKIREFWIRYWNENRPPFYHLMPKYNTINKTSIFRYLICKVADEQVLITYKLVHQFNIFQVRIFGYPISLNRRLNIENDVADVLRQKPFVRFLLNEDARKIYFAHADALDHCDDFYYDYDYQDVLSSRFVHHHYVQRFLKDDRFQHIMCIGESVPFDHEELVRMWFQWRDALYYIIPDRTHLEYKKFLYSPLVNKSILYCDGVPFGITIWDIDHDLNIARNYFNVHTGRYLTDDKYVNSVLKNITQIQKYLIGKYLVENTSVRKVFTAGADAHTDLTKLWEHKSETSYDRIRYYLCYD